MIFCDDDEKFFFFEPAKLLFLLFSVFAGLDFNYLLSNFSFLRKWRKVRDSNPRAPRRAASFQDWCIQPLYHRSGVSCIGNDPVRQMDFTFLKPALVSRKNNTCLKFNLFNSHIFLKDLRNLHSAGFCLIVFKNCN